MVLVNSFTGRTTPVNLLDEPAEPKASVPPPRPSKPPSRPPPPKKVMVPQDNIDLLTGSPSPEASAVKLLYSRIVCGQAPAK